MDKKLNERLDKKLGKDFYQYFQAIWADRWPALYESLLQKERQVLFHPFAESAEANVADEIEWLKSCLWLTQNRRDWIHQRDGEGLLKCYVMDPASVLVGRALEVGVSDHVLDMCAAPGGKALVLAQGLGSQGLLDANEISLSRRKRLIKVIQQYVPQKRRAGIFVRGKEGLRYGISQPDCYTRVLVDAPCSGERHLLLSPKDLKAWKPSRIKSLAKRQYGLLASALLAAKSGGLIVYSTCALSYEENDGVVERLLARKKGDVEVVFRNAPSPFAEKTSCGWIHLPDRCGFGPLYFSVLKKI